MLYDYCMPRLVRPSMKMKKFAREYVRTGNGKASVLKTYNTKLDATASQIASKNLKNPLVQEEIAKVLDKEGVTNSKVARGIKKIIEHGMRTKSLNEVKPSDTLKALEMAAKLKDLFPAERRQVEARTLNLNLEGKSQEELNDVLKNLENEMKSFRKMTQSPIIQDAKYE